MKWKKYILFIIFAIFVFLNITLASVDTRIPSACQDSDGDCALANINSSDNIYETLDLLTSPFGWLNVTNLNNQIPLGDYIGNATLALEWYTDVGSGAGNIRIEYYNGTAWISCAGPFSESASETNTTCDISNLSTQTINNIKIRFRGEDSDGFPNAFAYIDFVNIAVNHTSAPKWVNQSSVPSSVATNVSINLTAQGFSELALSYAWLSTNETGRWVNYTDGTYGSPLFLGDVISQWTYSNFTWKNSSFLSGNISWRIYYNDTRGRVNTTDVQSFYVQFTRLPISCTDSDGDCSSGNINSSNNVYEAIDLLTFPFGLLNVTDWNVDIPDGNILSNATAYVEWYTDIGLGASNIRIDYWSGNSWVNCAGPFAETASDTISSCNLSSLSLSEFNSVMIRFRGEDTEFPPAFAYVDYIYIDANYSESGIAFLEVNLSTPVANATTSITQNETFVINASVYCRQGECGNVNATARYNFSSSAPDTPINIKQGDVPFFIAESPANATKFCPSNPLTEDEFCSITWSVNATGRIGSSWKIDVLFLSDTENVTQNDTSDAVAEIISCSVDFTLQWSSIDFGTLNPSTGQNSAPGNSNNLYNISINQGSCSLDFYIRGSNLTNAMLGQQINVGNVTWSNVTNNYNQSFNMTGINTLIKANVTAVTNLTTWYWLNTPSIYAGNYNGSVFITGVKNGENP